MTARHSECQSDIQNANQDKPFKMTDRHAEEQLGIQNDDQTLRMTMGLLD
jgi:hypothetical protein